MTHDPLRALIVIVLACSGIGGLLLMRASRRVAAAERRSRWIKYLVYFAIVITVLGAAQLRWLWLVALVLLILAWGAAEIAGAFDGFSQVTGQLLGRHALAPRISPGKTTEGAAGGAIGALSIAALTRGLAHLPLVQALETGMLICLAGLAAIWRRAGSSGRRDSMASVACCRSMAACWIGSTAIFPGSRCAGHGCLSSRPDRKA